MVQYVTEIIRISGRKTDLELSLAANHDPRIAQFESIFRQYRKITTGNKSSKTLGACFSNLLQVKPLAMLSSSNSLNKLTMKTI